MFALLILAGAAFSQPVILEGTITEDMTLSNDNEYLLRGAVFIGDDENRTILTIEPGTMIYGERSSTGTLVIARHSQIMAEGTMDAPIVFTSDQAPEARNRGDWGGLILNGLAPLNTEIPSYGEGDTGAYGGDNPHDNSGTLRYVRVEFAGIEFSPDNELNGIALQGVGDGTIIEYVQVHMNKDDGIEFFGGTATAKYVFITGAADDQFDWTDGWTGKGQFWVCQQYWDDCDQGIEADNNGEDNGATPYSHPTIYNVTLVGAMNSENGESDIGMLLREGTQANIHNAIVINFGDAGIDLDHATTFANATDDNGETLNGNLTVDYSIFFNNDENAKTGETEGDDESQYAFTTVQFLETLNSNNTFTDPMLTRPYDMAVPNFTPMTGSPALSGYDTPPDDGFFEMVDYRGAFAEGHNWIYGWTTNAFPSSQEVPGLNPELPVEFLVGEAYPNPFNPTANVSISLPNAGTVKVAVYNMLGQQISNQVRSYGAGNHNVVFNAKNATSGIYFMQVEFNGTSQIRKLNLVK